MLIDSHVHLSHRRFDQPFRYLAYSRAQDSYSLADGSRESLIRELQVQDVGAVVEPAIDLSSNQKLLDLAVQYPGWLFPAVGLHPTRTLGTAWKDRSLLDKLAARSGVIAVGETGLDYHYPRKDQHRLCQIRWFVFQILLAHRHKLPLILHIRDADRAALLILRLFRRMLHGGVAHCFYGNLKKAETLLDLGFHLGIGGTLLQDSPAGEALCEVVKSVPLERILLETDCPYVHPSCAVVSSGKKRSRINNTSLILPAVAGRIAELKGLDPDTVALRTAENAIRLFALPVHP